MTVPDYPDWGTHQAIAQQISFTGVPLLSGDATLVNLSAQSLLSGASQTVYANAITGTSYVINLDALCQAAPTVPFVKLSMIWKDKAGGNTLDIQHWFILSTNVAPAVSNGLVCGRGPTESGFLVVILKNYDSAAITYDFELLASGRSVTRHDLRNVSNNISGSYTYSGQTFPTPVSDCPNNNLGNMNPVSIAAGASQVRVNGLFSGAVSLYVQSSGGVTYQVEIDAINPDFGTPLVPLLQFNGLTGNINQPSITLPRSPCLVKITNTGAGPTTLSYALMAQEFAS